MTPKETIFSPCRKYRYQLWREWAGGEGYAMFIGLNPSTADETNDDPTIRRCIGFAKAWGFGALCMTNIFAYRATLPSVMKQVADPVGRPYNDCHLAGVASNAGIIIAAWGVHGSHRNRASEVMKLIPNLKCLGITKDGHPKHPLYLRADSTPIPFGATP